MDFINTTFQKAIEKIKSEDLLRKLQFSNANYLDFTSNSYLNLHKHPEVIAKAIEYIKKYGTSFAVSPLIGRCEIMDEIFQILHNIYQKPTLIFPSGYQLNISVIHCVIKAFDNPIVFCDKLNHTSINEGLLASEAKFHRYKNCDLNHLENLLKKYPNNKEKLVLTESIFSMDGSVIDIENLMFLKRKYNFCLYIDEAHSMGIFGENGYGLCYKYREEIDFIMGTFSKALGSQGGFLISNPEAQNYLINKCKGLIYSTGLSPASIGAACESLALLPTLNNQRRMIFQQIKYINRILNTNFTSHIIPIMADQCSNIEKIINVLTHIGELNFIQPVAISETYSSSVYQIAKPDNANFSSNNLLHNSIQDETQLILQTARQINNPFNSSNAAKIQVLQSHIIQNHLTQTTDEEKYNAVNKLYHLLIEHNIKTSVIRYPTVAKNSPRLRVCLNSCYVK